MKKILFFVMIASSLANADCPSVSPTAEKLISDHATKVRGGEYCEFQRAFKKDSIEVVLYTIEGACNEDASSPKGSCGNNYIRYMVGVVNSKEIPPVVVGGKGSFLTQDVKIEGGEIAVSGRSYGPKDPMCCPSVENVRKYRIIDGVFVESRS